MSHMDRIKRLLAGKPQPQTKAPTWSEKCRKSVEAGKAALARMGPTTNLDMIARAQADARRRERVEQVRHESYERWLLGVEARTAANSERRKQAAAELRAYKSRKPKSHSAMIASLLGRDPS